MKSTVVRLNLVLAVLFWAGTFRVELAAAQSITPAPDGTGTIVTPNGNQFNIGGGTQSGANLYQSFQQFGLDSNQIATFLSRPDIQNILGRVVGGDPSVINGLIQVTGGNANLYLLNPSGIIFGANASLNVPASFTATTANGIQIGNSWFNAIGTNNYSDLNGTPSGFAFTQSGSIFNAGNLTVGQGQSLTLIGGTVVNTGTIAAPGGSITIAAIPGEKLVRITQAGSLLSLDLPIDTKAQLNFSPSAPLNLPALLTGSTLQAATGVTVENGVVKLTSSGTAIPTDSGVAIVSGKVTVASTSPTSPLPTTPQITILGDKVGLLSATLNASGINGGGTILIGGDYQGKGTVPNAQFTVVDAGSTIAADALTNGNGGKVILWSDQATRFYGKISATGGSLGGNGGLIETSGKDYLDITGSSVNAAAPLGQPGVWLLDPRNVTVQAAVTTGGTFGAGLFTPTADNAVIGTTDIVTALQGGTSVTITTGSTGSQVGDITVVDPISIISGGVTLTLQAANDIFVNAAIGTSSGGAFPVVINAGRDVQLNSTFATRSGNLQVTAGRDVKVNSNIDLSAAGVGGAFIINSTGAFDSTGFTLSTRSNNIDITSGTTIATGNLDTSSVVSGGNITLTAPGNITSGSLSTNGNNSGGNISVTSTNGSVSSTALRSSTPGTGTGGTITISGATGITIGDTRSFSTGGTGGAVTLTSSAGPISTGLLDPTGDLAGASPGGALTFTAQGDITTGVLNDTIISNNSPSGAITLTSNGGNVTIPQIIYNGGAPLSLTAANTLSVGGIAPVGTQVAGLISFTANRLDLTGGTNSINGIGTVQIQPFSLGQDIAIGSPSFSGSTTLDVTSTDLNALGGGFTSLTIGRTGGTGNVILLPYTFLWPVNLISGSTLTGPNQDTTWVINGASSGSVSGFGSPVNFSNIPSLIGGTANDSYDFLTGGSIAAINDLGGFTTVDYSTLTAPFIADLTNLPANTQVITGSSNTTATLIGRNSPVTWNLTSADSGTIGGTTFTSFQNLTGGSSDNIFLINPGASLSGNLAGGGGVNTLSYAAFTTPVTVDLAGNTSTAIGGTVTNIQTLIGGSATNTLIGANTPNVWTFTSSTGGTLNGSLTFSNFGTITGGNITNTFVVSDSTGIPNTLNGGGGINTLDYTTTASSNTTFNLSGSGLTSSSGAAFNLTGISNVNLTSSSNGNTFTVSNWSGNAVFNNSGNSNTYVVNFSGAGGNVSIASPSADNTLRIIGAAGATTLNLTPSQVSTSGRGGSDTVNYGSTIANLAIDTGTGNNTIAINTPLSFRGDVALGGTNGTILLGNNLSANRIDLAAPITLTGNATLAAQTGLTLDAQLDSTSAFTNDLTLTSSTIQINRAIGATNPPASLTIPSTTTVVATNSIRAGAVNFTVMGDINTQDITTTGRATGGSIALTSGTGTITSGDLNASGSMGGGSITLQAKIAIQTGAIDTSSLLGNAGNVNLDPQNDIQVFSINAQGGSSGFGGNVSVIAGRYFRSLGTFIDRNGLQASISTAGGLGGGDITIAVEQRDGVIDIPFIVGNATLNGTAGAITTGTVTIDPPRLFTQPYVEGNLRIIKSSTFSIDDILFKLQEDRAPLKDLLLRGLRVGDIDLESRNVEGRFTAEFSSYLGLLAESPMTLAQVQDTLSSVESATGVRSALIYINFVPAATGPSAALPKSLPDSEADLPRKLLWRSDGQGFAAVPESDLRTLGQNKPAHQDSDILQITLVTSKEKRVVKQFPEATRGQVLELAQKFRGEVTNINSDAYLPPAQKLYQLLIAPIEPELQARKIGNLVFIPDGGLRSLPVAALHDGQRFLVEKYSTGMMPSFSLTDTTYRSIKTASVLAMGASKFTEQIPLAAVPAELEAIVKTRSGETFLNEAFTLENLKDQRRQQSFSILHLATHGEFKPGEPGNSYIQLWDTKLRIDQIGQLQLSNPPVDLLVLSACRTAVGDDQAELGFAGFAIQAGVKSVLASLWYVSDSGTLGLMTEFYQQLQTAPTKSEALRRAQLAMIKGQVRLERGELRGSRGGSTALPPELVALGDTSLSHPYYWAAFTMIGNPW